MSKGGKSLCKDAMASIKTVMDSAVTADAPSGEASPTVITTKEAASIFLANADDTQRNLMKSVLLSLAEVDEIHKNTKQIRPLLGRR